MFTEAQFDQFEQSEHELTIEEFAAIVALLLTWSDDLDKEISSFYRIYGSDGVITYQEARKWVSEKDHRKRLTVLSLFILKGFDGVFNGLEKEFESHLRSIIANECKFFDVTISAEDVKKILYATWGIDKQNWKDRLWDYYYDWATILSNDMKIAFIKRTPIKDVLKDLKKRFVNMEKILWRLYLTETTALGSLARKEIFKQLGIKKYQFFSREDERRCEDCGALHGLIFPISAYEVGVTASPIHGHCRCWEVPIRE